MNYKVKMITIVTDMYVSMQEIEAEKYTHYKHDLYEWYGYIRAYRDVAFDNADIEREKIQNVLEKAYKIIKKI